MDNLKFRIFAKNDIYPKGKMYYPGDIILDNNRKSEYVFLINLFGSVLSAFPEKNDITGITHRIVFARIGMNDINVMLNTGMKDNYDKEIYEEDILRLWSYKDEDNPENDEYKDYLVYWNEGSFTINWEEEYSCCTLGYAITAWEADSTEYKDWQVIGNIFENPELLKEEE